MANIAKWNTPSLITVLSSETAITNGTMSAASSVIANNTNLDMYVDAEIFLGSSNFNPTGGNAILWLLEAIDGTNYPAQSAADLRLTPEQCLAYVWVGSGSSVEQRVVARNLVIPPGNFKVIFENATGGNVATGSTVKFLVYNVNGNA